MSAADRPTSREPHDDGALAAMWSQIGRRGGLTLTQMRHVFQIGEREGRAAMADAIEARDAEIAALRSVVRQLTAPSDGIVEDGWYHIVAVDGASEFVPFTAAQADAVRRALTEGDTP